MIILYIALNYAWLLAGLGVAEALTLALLVLNIVDSQH